MFEVVVSFQSLKTYVEVGALRSAYVMVLDREIEKVTMKETNKSFLPTRTHHGLSDNWLCAWFSLDNRQP